MAADESIRRPLLSTTNGSNSPTPSPPPSINKVANADAGAGTRAELATLAPTLHRKATLQDLVRLDSSESYPSPHSSLYEASVESVLTSGYCADDDVWMNARDTASLPPWANTVCDTNGDPVPISFLQPVNHPKMHTPHKLYPITEKPSLATLHPSLRSSFSRNRPSKVTLRSHRSRSPGLSGMRQKSFSLSDLPHKQSADHLPSDETSPSVTIRDVPFPNRPVHPPPVRSPTPPNIPRFGE